MALDITKLAGKYYGIGFSRWVYKTADAAATVDTAGYFNGAASMLKVGDIIDRITFTDGTFTAVSTYGTHIVNANDGSTVDVSDTTVGTVADTD